MTKLEYCISLRKKGLTSDEIFDRMLKEGFEEQEILDMIGKADKVILNQRYINEDNPKKRKLKNTLKLIILILSLFILIGAFLGYIQIGYILLVIFAGFLTRLKFSRRPHNMTYFKSKFRR
jgi:hypothetical protein